MADAMDWNRLEPLVQQYAALIRQRQEHPRVRGNARRAYLTSQEPR
jgi:hypothetical protein